MSSNGIIYDPFHPVDLLPVLVELGYLSAVNRRLVDRFAKKWDAHSFDAVLDCKIYSEEQLADIIAEVFHLERIYSIHAEDIDMDVLKVMAYPLAFKYEMIPLNKIGLDTIRVAVVNPTDSSFAKCIAKEMSVEFKVCISDRRTVRQAIQRIYPVSSQLPSLTVEG